MWLFILLFLITDVQSFVLVLNCSLHQILSIERWEMIIYTSLVMYWNNVFWYFDFLFGFINRIWLYGWQMILIFTFYTTLSYQRKIFRGIVIFFYRILVHIYLNILLRCAVFNVIINIRFPSQFKGTTRAFNRLHIILTKIYRLAWAVYLWTGQRKPTVRDYLDINTFISPVNACIGCANRFCLFVVLSGFSCSSRRLHQCSITVLQTLTLWRRTLLNTSRISLWNCCRDLILMLRSIWPPVCPL